MIIIIRALPKKKKKEKKIEKKKGQRKKRKKKEKKKINKRGNVIISFSTLVLQVAPCSSCRESHILCLKVAPSF